MDSHNKLTLGSGWCSTQLMPVLIRAWKYYLSLAARSKKSILSQVINSALSDCSPIPGSSMSLSWLLPLKYSLWLALSYESFHTNIVTSRMYMQDLQFDLTRTWLIIKQRTDALAERRNSQNNGGFGSVNALNVLAPITSPPHCCSGPMENTLKPVEFNHITYAMWLHSQSHRWTNNWENTQPALCCAPARQAGRQISHLISW